MMLESSNDKNACACKGIRRCLLCEDPRSQDNQNDVACVKVVLVRFVEMSDKSSVGICLLD